MPNIEKHNIPDSFNESIRQKLENHPLPIDENCWKEIEQRVQSKSKRKFAAWWITFSGVAAAIIIAVFILQSPPENPLTKPFSLVTSHKEISYKKEYPETHNQSTNASETQKKPSINKETESTKVNNRNKKEFLQTPTIEQEIALSQTNYTETVYFENITSNDSINSQKKVYPNLDTLLKMKDKFSGSSENLAEKPNTNKKNQNHWFLAVVVSSGFNTSNSQETSTSIGATSDAEGGISLNPNSGEKANNSKKNFDYFPPISFGILLHKKLNNHFGIESGLVYTYLFSKYADGLIQEESALHYLGVPLNLTISPWNFKRWNFYVSLGGMLEKGLSAKYSYNTYLNEPLTSDKHEPIDGWQWSVNASIGTAYRIGQSAEIYFEPRVSHYFNNEQPVSIRTEYPLIIGFNLGFRYKL